MQALSLPYSSVAGCSPLARSGTKREPHVYVSRERWRANDAVLLLAWGGPWTPAQALARSTRGTAPVPTNAATVEVDVRYGGSAIGTLRVTHGGLARQELVAHGGGILSPGGFSYTFSVLGESFDTLEVGVWLALRQPTAAEQAARELFGEDSQATSVGASLGAIRALRRALSE